MIEILSYDGCAFVGSKMFIQSNTFEIKNKENNKWAKNNVKNYTDKKSDPKIQPFFKYLNQKWVFLIESIMLIQIFDKV